MKKRFLIIFVIILVLVALIIAAIWAVYTGRLFSGDISGDVEFSLDAPADYAKYSQYNLKQESVDTLFNRLKTLRDELAVDPEDYEKQLSYAGLLKILHENDAAENKYQEIIEKFPDFGPAYAELADLYVYPLARYDEAMELYKQAVAKSAYRTDYYRALADLYISKFPDKKSEIEPMMLAGIEKMPSNAENFYSYLGAFFYQEKQYDKAIDYFQKCVEINPDNEIYSQTIKEIQAAQK